MTETRIFIPLFCLELAFNAATVLSHAGHHQADLVFIGILREHFADHLPGVDRDDPVGKLICEEVIPFADIPNELWLQFENQAFYESCIDDVMAALRDSDGKDSVIMYLKEERKIRRLSENWAVFAGTELLGRLYKILGEKNVKVVQKVIEKKGKVY